MDEQGIQVEGTENAKGKEHGVLEGKKANIPSVFLVGDAALN